MYSFKCSYCGFNNVTSFETIDDDDIGAVENFVREDLEDFIKSNENFKTNGKENQHMVEHFGEFYAQCPKKFRFLPGDLKFIKKIKEHIHDVVNKKGRKKAYQHFSNETNRTKNAEYTVEVNQNDQITGSKFIDNGLKKKLYDLISNKLVEFNVHPSTREIFDESFISIENKNNRTTGNIICVVCHVQKKDSEHAKPKHVYCRGKSWVISNFVKHFTRAHSELVTNNELMNNDSNQLANENEIYENEAAINDEVVEYVIVEEVDPLSYELNYSTESLQNFIAKDTSEMEKKFNDQISSQLIKMWNTVTLNCESQDLQVQCKCENGISVSVDVANIHKDGNCLFGSLAHQIYRHNLNSDAHKSATNTLRNDVVNYIKQNYEEFEQHLRGHIMELEESGLSDAFGLHGISDIDAKCKHLLNNCLVNSGFWASGESLKAVAHVCNVNIIVIYENGPMYCVTTGELSDRTVVIAYRLPDIETSLHNHYDSVYSISATDIYKIAKYISEVLNQDSNLMIDLVTSP